MDWKATLAEVIAERRQELGERPSTEKLIALRAGELSADERERLLEHASWDPEVARELFDLLRFPELPADEAVVESDSGTDRRWQTMRAKLLSEGILPRTPAPEPKQARAWTWLPLTSSFAAGMALAFAIGELRSPVGTGPSGKPAPINLPIVELLALSETAVGGRRGSEVTVLPASADGIVLTLAVPGLPSTPGTAPYELAIRREGQEILRTKGLVPGEGGVFVLLLPRVRLEAGAYELLLSDGDGQPAASFRLEVELGR